MIRTPTLALALAALAWPAFAQDAASQQAEEGTEPATAEQDTAEMPADDAAATEAVRADADMSQGGTGALVNGEGAQIGNASVSITASGEALVLVQAEGIPEGVHGIHLHMVGACEGPTFESAGEHIADGHEHGVMAADGPHPGDLPNATALADGTVTYEAFAAGLTMDLLFDADGSALMIHAEPDDYATQPGGASGDRIACAVIEAGGEMAPGATDTNEDGAAEEPSGG